MRKRKEFNPVSYSLSYSHSLFPFYFLLSLSLLRGRSLSLSFSLRLSRSLSLSLSLSIFIAILYFLAISQSFSSSSSLSHSSSPSCSFSLAQLPPILFCLYRILSRTLFLSIFFRSFINPFSVHAWNQGLRAGVLGHHSLSSRYTHWRQLRLRGHRI